MSMELDFLTLLRRTPAVYELTGTRISIDRRPQKGNEPAIVVSRISGGHDHTLTASGGWAQPVMHVMCFADDAIKANNLRDIVRNALQSFSGVVGNTKFDSMILDDEDHDYLEPIDASDSGTFARLLVFRVLHSERIPTFS
jgi:hypothetical protein